MSNELHEWFIYLFESQMDENGYINCFECKKPMHQDIYKTISTCYSHLVSKKKYKKYKGNVENVKIVHPNCHYLFTNSPKKAVNQYNAMLEFKKKYNL